MIAQLQQQCNSIALSKSDLQQRFTQSSRLQNSIAQSSLASSQLAQSYIAPLSSHSSQSIPNLSQNPGHFSIADIFNNARVYEEKIERLKTMGVNQSIV